MPESFEVKIDKKWGMPGQTVNDGEGGVYLALELIELAKDLPEFELPLFHIDITNIGFKSSKMRDFVSTMKQVNDADLDYPILLDHDGFILDGRHRIAKALLHGHESVKAKRFIEKPPRSYRKEEE